MKKRSLKMVMLTYAAVVMVFMVAVVSAFWYYHYSTTREYVLSSYEGLREHLEAQFLSAVSSIQKTALDASYSSAVQNCTFTSDPSEYFSFRSAADTTMDLLHNNNQYSAGLFVISDNNRMLYNTNAPISSFRKTWGYLGEGFQDRSNTRGFIVKGAEGAPKLWHIAPVYRSGSVYFDVTRSGHCAILCDLSPLTQSLDLGTGYNSGIAILHKGNILSSNRPITGSEREILTSIEDGVSQAVSERYLVKAVELPLPDWQLTFITPESAIASQAMQFGTGSLLALLAFILITLAFVTVVFFITTHPVNRMLAQMRALRNANWDSRLSDSRISEFSELVGGINETLDSMQNAYQVENETQQRLYQAVIAQTKAKLDAYRMQINSHFLFNTLECMRSMASQYGAEPVEEMIESLSFMFRYTYDAGDIVPLHDEIQHLQHYVNVMNMRYQGRFHLRLDVKGEAIEDWMVCSMVLQPIAENSIRHGFSKKAPPNNMLLQCRLLPGGALLVRFTDNGNGILPERLERVHEGLSTSDQPSRGGAIGLANINHRLRLASAGTSGLSIASVAGHYTCVSFSLEWEPGR